MMIDFKSKRLKTSYLSKITAYKDQSSLIIKMIKILRSFEDQKFSFLDKNLYLHHVKLIS